MKRKFSFATLCLIWSAATLLGCATAGKDIKTNAVTDPKANLKAYKTYIWAGSMGAFHDPQGRLIPTSFDFDAETRFLIDQEMRSKGFTLGEEGNADVEVFYLVDIDTDVQAGELKKRYGDKADISGLAEGSLVVGLVDAETDVAIWMGSAQMPVKPEHRDDEMAKQRLAAAVKGIFNGLQR